MSFRQPSDLGLALEERILADELTQLDLSGPSWICGLARFRSGAPRVTISDHSRLGLGNRDDSVILPFRDTREVHSHDGLDAMILCFRNQRELGFRDGLEGGMVSPLVRSLAEPKVSELARCANGAMIYAKAQPVSVSGPHANRTLSYPSDAVLLELHLDGAGAFATSINIYIGRARADCSL